MMPPLLVVLGFDSMVLHPASSNVQALYERNRKTFLFMQGGLDSTVPPDSVVFGLIFIRVSSEVEMKRRSNQLCITEQRIPRFQSNLTPKNEYHRFAPTHD